MAPVQARFIYGAVLVLLSPGYRCSEACVGADALSRALVVICAQHECYYCQRQAAKSETSNRLHNRIVRLIRVCVAFGWLLTVIHTQRCEIACP